MTGFRVTMRPPRRWAMSAREASLARAIRGPITLITLGVLFALNNFTPFGFDKTWPVLLIVFGLLSLLRRGMEPAPPPRPAAPRYGYPPTSPGMPPGGYAQSPYAGTPQAPGPVKEPGSGNHPPSGESQ